MVSVRRATETPHTKHQAKGPSLAQAVHSTDSVSRVVGSPRAPLQLTRPVQMQTHHTQYMKQCVGVTGRLALSHALAQKQRTMSVVS
jgi:hypothetical protein